MVSTSQLQHAIAHALTREGQGQPDQSYWTLLPEEFRTERVIENWAKSAEVRDVPVLAFKVPPNEDLRGGKVPLVAKRIAVACNVCARLGVRIRPIGHHDEALGKVPPNNEDKRDRLHNWSPINLDLEPGGDTVLYLSFQWISTVYPGRKELLEVHKGPKLKAVRAYCGETVAHVGELANRHGLTPPILTAPHVLSLGGVLAISGHGSRLSDSDRTDAERQAGVIRDWPGTISASVDSATVITWQNGRYEATRVQRGSDELGLAAACLGRVIVVDVTLRCLDDYSLVLRYENPSPGQLFGAQPGANKSLEWYAQNGAFEVLAFRDLPWTPNRIYVAHWRNEGNNLNWNHPAQNPLADLFGTVFSLGLLDLMPWWLATMIARYKNNKEVDESPSNLPGPAAKMRMYATSDAPPVTASGYCLIIPRDKVQETAEWAYNWSQRNLANHPNDAWGVHQYLTFETRCADLDDHGLPPGAKPPLLSTAAPLAYDANGDPVPSTEKHVVLWISVLSLNNGKSKRGRGDFYYAMETELFQKAQQEGWRVRPEWAKGWGYNRNRAWTWAPSRYHQWFEQSWPGDENTYGSWKFACRIAWEMDPHGVLASAFHDKLLPRPASHVLPGLPPSY